MNKERQERADKVWANQKEYQKLKKWLNKQELDIEYVLFEDEDDKAVISLLDMFEKEN